MQVDSTSASDSNSKLDDYLRLGSALQTEIGPFMVDQTLRQAILHCWLMLPDEERSMARVRREIHRLLHRAYRDMQEDAEIYGFVQKNADAKGSLDERYPDARAKYPRAYEAWTEGGDAELRGKYVGGATVQQLAEYFQRQPGAINARLRKLGIT